MEPQVNRDAVTMEPPHPQTEPVRIVEQTTVPEEQPVTRERATYVDSAPADHGLARTESITSVAPHSIAAGILAVLMLVWGGVAMARAGFGDDLRDPVVEVFGLSGNAVSGIIVAGLGLLLLIAAVSRDRGPVVFLTIVIGIAAVIFAIEPNAGDEALGVETTLPLLIAIGCGIVLLAALALPTVNRRTQHIERS
jgi:hypothetical protein